MKTKLLLLLGLIIILGSCSSAYRTGQTPDDVYYSPAPTQNGYVRTDNQDEKDSYANNNSSYNNEDMEIRRGIKDSRYRNNVSVDLGYGYPTYDYYNSYSYYNPYSYSGVYYNPYYYNSYNLNCFPNTYSNYYYSPQVYYYPKSGNVNRSITPRKYNLDAYTNNATPSTLNHGYRPVNATTTSAPIRTITTAPSNSATVTPAARNSGNGVSNFIRRVFTPENNSNRGSSNTDNYNNSNSSSVRTTPSSSSGSNNSSSGSSSAPVRTFRK